MPRRLLDLHNGEPGIIRLVDTAATAPYAALSYCWSADESVFYKTTSRNLERHHHGMSIHILPKTIQDAITVSRKLEIAYLWVDALCIVQDNHDDWRQESAQMCTIYGNSVITIAVHQSTSCDDGFLASRRSGNHNGNAPSAHVKMHVRFQHPEEWFKTSRPLMSRGWTFQEAILPRRIIHFTDAELIWECEERSLCECGHMASPLFHRPNLVLNLSRPLVPRTLSVSQRWMYLVERYSLRKFTNPADKLIAISGLVQWVARFDPNLLGEVQTQDISSFYLAGLFRRFITSHLLWSTKRWIPTNGTKRRPLLLLALSWSWASVDEHVYYLNQACHPEKSHVRIHHHETWWKPAIAEYEVGDQADLGRLAIEGHMVPVRLVRELDSETLTVYHWNVENGSRLDFTCWDEPPLPDETAHGSGDVTPRYWCLKMATIRMSMVKIQDTNTYYLVLERVESDTCSLEDEKWRRVGIGYTSSDQGWSYCPSPQEKASLGRPSFSQGAEWKKIVII
ncbi:Heterokaryon incompatibility protein (HET) domain containing protein [Rhypophila decipiens]